MNPPRIPIWSRNRPVIGIDPGRSGAIALIRSNGRDLTVQCWNMPSHDGNRGIDIRAMLAIMDELDPKALVGLEYNSGRPGETPDFAYRFGLQTGQLEGLFRARGFEVKCISPNLWTGKLGLPGKQHPGAIEQRAAMWDRLYPAYAGLIRGPKGGIHDGPLDALLISHWLRLTESSPVGKMGGRRPPRWMGRSDLTAG